VKKARPVCACQFRGGHDLSKRRALRPPHHRDHLDFLVAARFVCTLLHPGAPASLGRDFFALPLAGATSAAGCAPPGDKRETARQILAAALRSVNFFTGFRSESVHALNGICSICSKMRIPSGAGFLRKVR
jgi:hypothetical protein